MLGVIGRRYHADFRAALRDALRNSNGFIRAQAAAVASRLDIDEKSSLWSVPSPNPRDHAAPTPRSENERRGDPAEC